MAPSSGSRRRSGGWLVHLLALAATACWLPTAQVLQGWFARLQKKGLTHIQGRIVLDQSMYRLTEKDHANTPVPEAGNPHHAWPDAFVVDQRRFEVLLNRAADGNLQARFEPAEPPGAAIAVSPADVTPVGTTTAPLAPLARVVLSGQWHAGCKNPI